MKVSLNNIVQMIADRVGQPFNIPLQRQLKVIANYKRAEYFHKILDKRPEQRKYFLKEFTVELETVDKAECVVSGCTTKKSLLEVPLPVRTSSQLFDYVGDANKEDAYRYMTPDQVKISLSNIYTSRRPSYYYSNSYLYIYNDNDISYVNVRGVFTDPKELEPFKCGSDPCYTDDDTFDISEDVVNTMVQDILKNELRNVFPEKGEVEISPEDKEQ